MPFTDTVIDWGMPEMPYFLVDSTPAALPPSAFLDCSLCLAVVSLILKTTSPEIGRAVCPLFVPNKQQQCNRIVNSLMISLSPWPESVGTCSIRNDPVTTSTCLCQMQNVCTESFGAPRLDTWVGDVIRWGQLPHLQSYSPPGIPINDGYDDENDEVLKRVFNKSTTRFFSVRNNTSTNITTTCHVAAPLNITSTIHADINNTTFKNATNNSNSVNLMINITRDKHIATNNTQVHLPQGNTNNLEIFIFGVVIGVSVFIFCCVGCWSKVTRKRAQRTILKK